jgi:hypothetical protein
MKVLSTERSKRLAEQNGWSPAFAQGHVDGEAARRLGNPPTVHARVGIDEYSLGFRAGYFERQHVDALVTVEMPLPVLSPVDRDVRTPVG